MTREEQRRWVERLVVVGLAVLLASYWASRLH